MSQTVKLRLSKNDQVVGELDVKAFPSTQKKSHKMLSIVAGLFFLSTAILSLYIVIYLLFN